MERPLQDLACKLETTDDYQMILQLRNSSQGGDVNLGICISFAGRPRANIDKINAVWIRYVSGANSEKSWGHATFKGKKKNKKKSNN